MLGVLLEASITIDVHSASTLLPHLFPLTVGDIDTFMRC